MINNLETQKVNEPNNNKTKKSKTKEAADETTSTKKGRKPKGGKIIDTTDATFQPEPESSNIILHLKCFKKDLTD